MVNTISNRYRSDDQLLNLISENIREGLIIVDCNAVVFANKNCQRIFETSSDELIGLSLEELLKFLGLKRQDRCLTEKDIDVLINNESAMEVYFTGSAGHTEVLNINIQPFSRGQESNSRIILFRNITQNVVLKTETDRLHRISTLGKISSGIAHDLNHLLSIIYLENTRLLLRTTRQEHKACLERIGTAITQAMGIVSRIKNFGKTDKLSTTLIDINELVERTIGLLKTYWEGENNLNGKRIDVVFNPGSSCGDCRILGNPSGLSSVLINLINNAMEAIKEKGEVRLSTFNHNSHIFVTISDNGIGMTRDVQRNLFRLYYSTKKDRGSGLGLFISREIILEHKGTIKAISSPEKGTTFIISLPVAPGLPCEKRADFNPGNKIIFIIEDEKPICALLCDVFLRAGYKVVASQRRDEALQHLSKHKPDVIISDLCIPGMSFYELVSAIKSIKLDIPIILLTGYGSDIDEETRNNLGIKAVISKPFSQKEILKAVERVLNA